MHNMYTRGWQRRGVLQRSARRSDRYREMIIILFCMYNDNNIFIRVWSSTGHTLFRPSTPPRENITHCCIIINILQIYTYYIYLYIMEFFSLSFVPLNKMIRLFSSTNDNSKLYFHIGDGNGIGNST